MKNRLKKVLTGFLTAALSLSLLTACTSKEVPETTKSTETAQEQTETQGQAETQEQSEALDFSDALDPSEAGSAIGADVTSVGEFTTQDVNGEEITQDIFKEHKLTMVNVFTTWCTPCVQEMPDLEKLHQQVKDQDVGVVGVVLDVLNEKGEIVDEDLERAQLLVEKTGVTYPVLLPDSGYFNNRLIGIEAFPETFFVDENGNIVGGHYSGSGGLEDWLEVVENELADLGQGE